MDILNIITEPLGFEFFRNAIAGVMLVAGLCGVVGSFVILRGLSYIGDAMSHAVFPGIVLAFLWNINYFLGGAIAAILTALGINWVSERSGLRQDAAVGTVFVGMFALGIVLLSSTKTYSVDLAHLLVGDPLGITREDLWVIAGLGGVIVAIVLGLRKELVLVAFDEVEAAVVGLPVAKLNALVLVLIALTVVLAIQMVGSILVVSLLVTAASTARLLSTRFGPMLGLAAGLGALAGVLGLYFSYYLDVPNGAMIVLVNTAIFLATLVLRRQKVLKI
jgi:manganese/iron transport system permease protein